LGHAAARGMTGAYQRLVDVADRSSPLLGMAVCIDIDKHGQPDAFRFRRVDHGNEHAL
jgi:hypothetical protein